jgi:SAM-dependent methyltransferase
MDQRVRETIGSYAVCAARYAQASSSYQPFPGLREAVEEFHALAQPGLPVLDAGCGAGRDSRRLARLGRVILALDACEALLRAWPRSERSAADRPPLRLLADLAAPPLRERSLGGIWTCAALLHQPSETLPLVLARLVRLLVTGGIMMTTWRCPDGTADEGYVEWNGVGRRWQNLVPPDLMLDHLAAAGLDAVQWRTTGDHGWYAAWGTSMRDIT